MCGAVSDDLKDQMIAAVHAAESRLSVIDEHDLDDAQQAFLADARRVVAYARLAVEQVEPGLISGTAHEVLVRCLGSDIASWGVESLTPHNRGVLSDILNHLAYLPPARGHTAAQNVSQQTAAIHQAIESRRQIFDEAMDALQTRLLELRTAADVAENEIREEIAKEFERLDRKAASLSETLADTEARSQAAITEQAQTFRQQAADNEKTFKAQITELESAYAELRNRSEQEASQLLETLTVHEEEARTLVGLVGETATAGHYGKHADQQAKQANLWRLISMGLAAAALLIAAYVAIAVDASTEWQRLVAKLGVSAAFGGVAAYAARQSSLHRAQERKFRALELELAAFGPFTEDLPDEQRDSLRATMADRAFKGKDGDSGEEPSVL